MSDCRNCTRSSESRGLCKYHLVRQKLASLGVGDEVFVNGNGPFTVRRRVEIANSDGFYVDTHFRLSGNHDDGSLWIIRLYCNDSGQRGSGRPGYHAVDAEGNRTSGANHAHSLRYAECPDEQAMIAEHTAGDLIDELR